MQRYWWGHHEKEMKVHWVKRERMGRSKQQGGMGFRDLESFNKALLAKQCWRILKNPESLSARILKTKYFPSGSILDAPLGWRPSYIWRSIWLAQDLLSEGLKWRVGNDNHIRIWKDHWLPQHIAHCVFPRQGLHEEAYVSKLFDKDTNAWNTSLVSSLVRRLNANIICQIPIGSNSCSDRQI